MVLVKFGSFFIKPKTAGWAWGILVLVLILGYATWSWNTIQHQKAEAVATQLEAQNLALTKNNELLVADQKSILERMDLLAGSLEALQGSFSRNMSRRQSTVDTMTYHPEPGQSADTAVIQDRANTGMNGLFSELELISGNTGGTSEDSK